MNGVVVPVPSGLLALRLVIERLASSFWMVAVAVGWWRVAPLVGAARVSLKCSSGSMVVSPVMAMVTF